MTKFTRVEVINSMYDLGLVPIFYQEDLEVAKSIVNACADGGARVMEFTNRRDSAYQIFSKLVKHLAVERPDVILGAGSVLDPATAALYINSGANFVVGPVFDRGVAEVCNRRKIAYSPGCGSASEISQAEAFGVELVRISPGAHIGGPSFIKAIVGPMPWTSMMPTCGVEASRESIHEWIQAGAACLGMGSKLITKDVLSGGDWAGLKTRVEKCLWFVKEARGESLFAGVEHIGLCPKRGQETREVANWYAETFGFKITEENGSLFVWSSEPGFIEIMKQLDQDMAHVAIRVHNFDLACEALRAKGFMLDDSRIIGKTKLAYLKQRDPIGNRVHVICRN